MRYSEVTPAYRWLFVCSANYVRSPTAEYVARRSGLLADSCGSDAEGFIVQRISADLVRWAEVIVGMEEEHLRRAKAYRGGINLANKHFFCWHLPDDWPRPYEPDLIRIIEHKLEDTLDALIGKTGRPDV